MPSKPKITITTPFPIICKKQKNEHAKKNCPQNLSSHHHQLFKVCHFLGFNNWCDDVFIHQVFHHPNFVSEWLLFFFRNPCFFIPLYLVEIFSLCTWDQIPCVVPFAVDECDLVPCAVSTIPPTPLHHKRLRGCRNCEQAFFVRAKFQQMAIFSIGKTLGLCHRQILFFLLSKSPDSILSSSR